MFRILTAGVTAVAVVAVSSSGVTHASSRDSRAFTLCKTYQHMTVRRGSDQYIVRNDNYGRDKECLANQGQAANFAVTKSSARASRVEPVAFPNIFAGCSWGLCSPRSVLPLRADRISSLVTTWHTTTKARGTWGAGYDIWFARKPARSGQSGGAEMMIWLNSRGFGLNTWPVVVIDHVRWHLAHWVTGGHGKRWNYIQFRRVASTSKVTNLRVKPFIAAAERYRLIKPRWWLTSVEAGFEIWRGGVGLRTTQFMVRLSPAGKAA